MKTLLLMRHAKSSWKDPDLADRDRPLTKRGKRDALRMGEMLKEMELIPQRILCSSAARAKLTGENILEGLHISVPMDLLDDLYMAETPTYFEKLGSLPETLDKVMVIGHNPGLEALMLTITHQVEALPTCAVAYVILPIEHWEELSDEVSGDLIHLWRPKELEA
ncbi:MAG: histidine phosphatase family protein [Anaerolineaceae bacterium]